MTHRQVGIHTQSFAAGEVLLANRAVCSMIREGSIEKQISVIQSGGRDGMQLMDDCLEALVRQNAIDPADAYMKSLDKGHFAKPVETG